MVAADGGRWVREGPRFDVHVCLISLGCFAKGVAACGKRVNGVQRARCMVNMWDIETHS